MDPITGATEALFLLIRMWMMYQKQQGLTDEQISQSFAQTFGKFMVVSAVPVDPVKE